MSVAWRASSAPARRVRAGCIGDPAPSARQALRAWVADLPAGRQEGFGSYRGPARNDARLHGLATIRGENAP
jgi:hypothetical protein